MDVPHREVRPDLQLGIVGHRPGRRGAETTGGLHIPFYLEHELRASHPRGVIARLSPYTSYYRSPEPGDDQPPFPVTLFAVGTENVEGTYLRTAARTSRMSLPIFVSCRPVLSTSDLPGAAAVFGSKVNTVLPSDNLQLLTIST